MIIIDHGAEIDIETNLKLTGNRKEYVITKVAHLVRKNLTKIKKLSQKRLI